MSKIAKWTPQRDSKPIDDPQIGDIIKEYNIDIVDLCPYYFLVLDVPQAGESRYKVLDLETGDVNYHGFCYYLHIQYEKIA